jgi:hypothetical protein
MKILGKVYEKKKKKQTRRTKKKQLSSSKRRIDCCIHLKSNIQKNVDKLKVNVDMKTSKTNKKPEGKVNNGH